MAGNDVKAWLERLASGCERVRLNARTTAELVTNTHCSARRALDAAGIDKAALATRLGVESQRGQSPFAITRGDRFERRVKRDEYLELLRLLRPFGLETRTVQILDVAELLPFARKDPDETLERRAAETRRAIVEIANGTAVPGLVIDHGALTWTIGGVSVRLETDAIAWWVGGKLRVVEIKSYPIEWGQVPADKISAMAWQTAVYVAAVQDLLSEEGLDPALVSTEIFLICPSNTGLAPAVVTHDVAPQLRLLRRYERRETGIDDLMERVGEVSFVDGGLPDGDRRNAIAATLAALGPRYQPNCLATCDLAAHCRSCAQEAGDPNVIGGDVVQLMTGVADMRRAGALADGGVALVGEHEFEAMIDRTATVENAVLNGLLP